MHCIMYNCALKRQGVQDWTLRRNMFSLKIISTLETRNLSTSAVNTVPAEEKYRFSPYNKHCCQQKEHSVHYSINCPIQNALRLSLCNIIHIFFIRSNNPSRQEGGHLVELVHVALQDNSLPLLGRRDASAQATQVFTSYLNQK